MARYAHYCERCGEEDDGDSIRCDHCGVQMCGSCATGAEIATEECRNCQRKAAEEERRWEERRRAAQLQEFASRVLPCMRRWYDEHVLGKRRRPGRRSGSGGG